jgi:hypothetical protein
MSAELIYRLLLRAYPPAFRAEYGREMVLVFRDQCRDGDVRTLGFWMRVLWDIVRSAPALRAEATRTVEVIMKLAAILTVLLAAFGMFGAVNDWSAASQHAGTYVLAIVLGVAASLLLLGAGVAILLQKRQAARLVLVASLSCFVAARLLFPWMGIFLQLVGSVLPVGLLIALYWPRKSSTLGAASIALVVLSGLGVAVPQLCRAQALPLGRWTGWAGPMDRSSAHPITFDVTPLGDSIQIMLRPDDGNDYRLDAIRLHGDTLRFTLHLAHALPPGDRPGGAHGSSCTLLRQRGGYYSGLCTGPDGMRSDMSMVPPGSTRAADTVKDLPLTAAQRQSFVGSYSVMLPMGGQDVLRIFEENGILKAHSSHENRTGRLLYQGDGAFRPEGSDFVITFVIEAGRATSFQGLREDGVIKGTRTQ